MKGRAKMSNPLFNAMQSQNPMQGIMNSPNPQAMAMQLLQNRNPQAFAKLNQLMQSGATPEQAMQAFGINAGMINQFRNNFGNNVG